MLAVKRGFILNQKNRCTAWVKFDGSTTPPTIKDSFNVSSVTWDGADSFNICFKTPMLNSNYSTTGMSGYTDNFLACRGVYATTYVKVISRRHDNVVERPNLIGIQVFGGMN